MPAPLSLEAHFEALDQLLQQHRHLWQLRTFECTELPWPELQPWLGSLDHQQRQQLLNDETERREALRPYIAEIDALESLCRIAPSTPSDFAAPPARLGNHIPGRKWQQIQAFNAALRDSGRPFLEWCAGKGHLGRLLAFQRQRPVTSLELQPQLCQHGQQLADKQNLPCTLHAVDVMTPKASAHLQPAAQQAVALHACGQLHIQLLEQVAEHQLEALSVSPCCYHLIEASHYQPLSSLGQRTSMRLSRYDLGLSVQETVTAGSRERRLRQQELRWRLGFDQLQRQLRGVDQYLNCPTLPRSVLSGSFTDFCRQLAARKQLVMPDGIDFDAFEQQGEERVVLVEQLEIVRQLFRRPLEIWLVLDRGLFLQQQGYDVSIETFCERQLTPRNLLIQARRRD
ncbi:methyltransferase [Motiliproteus coralliicola]|uniref:Methyltransferase n=1 Tax=Motiliproteus coralliicola TaxID=2283196 RepID=A0A369WDW6_9GAMM|nr:methyltransferase [Motiliproteus coralliicola]RDE19952.1 methyltransferase [Motiliproteus coralliicola]